ncbi:hypothetical protein P692DRAFT_20842310 [Suillus brevipes Sb2]|nr:hypothetical protein P692DRAFT_20842310 [Suillus brevipes Sb2]
MSANLSAHLLIHRAAKKTELNTGTKDLHLPGYPMGIGEGTDNWPKDPATGKDLIRFDWRVGKHDDSINTAGLQRVVDRIRLVGPQMGDAAKGILSAILPGQIEKNISSIG